MLKPGSFLPEGVPKASGFVNPSEYSAPFAALSSESFGVGKDYFESAQRKDSGEDRASYETKPGPNYASIKAPAQFSYENRGHKKGHATEVHDLTEKPPSRQQAKKKKKQQEESVESGESDDYNYPYYDPSANSPGKVVDYNTGKSSSTVSQNPHAPGYYSKLLNSPKSTATPYQKYSFQPTSDSDYLSAILSTVAPYNPSYTKSTSFPALEPQSSDAVPKHLEDKNCKKIDKQVTGRDFKTGRVKRQSMNCFICKDPKTGVSFEECSYATNIAPQNYFAAATNSYSSSKNDPDTYRHKRYSGDESYVDPYQYVKSQNKYNSRPKEFDSKHYQPKVAETKEDYSYSFPKKEKSEPVKSFSERKAEELIKKGENCEQVQREEMTCVVCVSEETGGNYEQCSYSSAPAQQKYAYVKEHKFDGPTPPPETKGSSSSASEEVRDERPQSASEKKSRTPYEEAYKSSKPDTTGRSPASSNQREEKQKPASRPEVSNRGSSRYQVPKHFEETKTKQERKPNPSTSYESKYGRGESNEKVEQKEKDKKAEKKEEEDEDDPYEYPSLSEYHFKYFPEFLKDESKAEESQIVSEKKDVEDVLAEFAKKDRSTCQKAEKNGMTCYLCVDKNGLQHEECMYISESRPKSTHVAYHEVQELPAKNGSKSGTIKEEAEPKAAASNISPVVVAASEEQIKKIKYKANTPLHAADQKANESKNQKVPKKYKPAKSKEQATSESRTDEQEEDEGEGGDKQAEDDPDKLKIEEGDKITDVPDPVTPEEFQVGEKEGAFSEETQPVYSKALGITLPKYMLTKSESESVFDEFVESLQA